MSSTPHKGRRCTSAVIVVFVVSVCVILLSGTLYAFPTWSVDMKAALHYSTADIELIGAAGMGSGFLGGIVGALVIAMSPRINCLIAASLFAVGFVGMASPLLGVTALASPLIVAFNYFLAATGTAFLYCVILAVNTINIPARWIGTALATLATTYGISSFLFATVYTALLHNRILAFFLFAAVMCTVGSIISAVVVQERTYETDDVDVQSSAVSDDNAAAIEDATVSPRLLLADDCHHISKLKALDDEDALEEDIEMFISASPYSAAELRSPLILNDAAEVERPHSSPLQRTLHVFCLLLRQPMFYFIFAVMFIIGGAGVFQINNIGLIVQSLNGGQQDDVFTLKLVGVLTLTTAIGHLTGILSDFTRVRRGVYLIIGAAMMTACHIGNYLFVTTKTAMFYSVIVGGLAYGITFGIIGVIIAEAFGRRVFAIAFGFILMSFSLASVVFNLIGGALYDAQLQTGTTVCAGINCFRGAYLLCSGTSCIGLIISLIICTRTKRGLKGGRVRQLDKTSSLCI